MKGSDMRLRRTASDVIKEGLLQGKNSVQLFLLVKDEFPRYEDRKLRKLISVIKAKYFKK
jgi:hypothetical protein